MKIYAPVKDFNGLRNNVRFVRGVGETDNPNAIAWFKRHGYTVEMSEKIPNISDEKSDNTQVNLIIDTQNEQIEVLDDKVEPDFDNMTPLELREWAIANGLGSKIRNTRNKEKLLEIIRG